MTYQEVTDHDFNSISSDLIIEVNDTHQTTVPKVKFLDYIADTRGGLLIDTEEKRVAVLGDETNRARIMPFDRWFKWMGGELKDLVQDFVDHSDDLDFEQVRDEPEPMEDLASEAYRDLIAAQRL